MTGLCNPTALPQSAARSHPRSCLRFHPLSFGQQAADRFRQQSISTPLTLIQQLIQDFIQAIVGILRQPHTARTTQQRDRTSPSRYNHHAQFPAPAIR
ncbi:MAG: hypothetical protein HC866_26175 [Leptolyngbyaceae cyanobacterium RU_5_1]|nr:hypothetical protein [Leptolyngbyaceae cyanobacterium RU_5_1]